MALMLGSDSVSSAASTLVRALPGIPLALTSPYKASNMSSVYRVVASAVRLCKTAGIRLHVCLVLRKGGPTD